MPISIWPTDGSWVGHEL